MRKDLEYLLQHPWLGKLFLLNRDTVYVSFLTNAPLFWHRQVSAFLWVNLMVNIFPQKMCREHNALH